MFSRNLCALKPFLDLETSFFGCEPLLEVSRGKIGQIRKFPAFFRKNRYFLPDFLQNFLNFFPKIMKLETQHLLILKVCFQMKNPVTVRHLSGKIRKFRQNQNLIFFINIAMMGINSKIFRVAEFKSSVFFFILTIPIRNASCKRSGKCRNFL